VAKEYGLKVYHQTDPRGCALYLYRYEDLDRFAERIQSKDVSIRSCYNSIGFAVVP
jgi:hypothetical protein